MSPQPRPPKLPDAPRARTPRALREPTRRARLVKGRVAGRHERLGRAELLAVLRRVVQGEPGALCGLARLPGLEVRQLHAVVHAVWGWSSADALVAIDPDRTLESMRTAIARVRDVARRGGRVAFATGRPASLLGLHLALARTARAAGAAILGGVDAGPVRAAGRSRARVWWLDGVAVVTDGDALLADPGVEALQELLFTVGVPDLVVADRAFAGGAAQAGIEVVAFADLDAAALGAGVAHGLPITVVPLQERRPPAAYAPLVELVADDRDQVRDPERPTASDAPPHPLR